MKWIAVLLLVTAGVGVAGFQKYAPFRERVRRWNASNSEKPALETYLKGKTLLRNAWTGDAGAEYAAWGDDPSIYAKPLTGDIWKAHGRVTYTLEGTRVTHPWTIIFDRDSLDPIAARVGPDADEVISRAEQQVLAGEAASAAAASPPGSSAPPANPAAKRGDWMFKNYKPALDPPARRR